METTIVHWGYIEIMENKVETTIMENQMDKKMENEMETTIMENQMEKKMENEMETRRGRRSTPCPNRRPLRIYGYLHHAAKDCQFV